MDEQDLRELAALRLINHDHSQVATDCERAIIEAERARKLKSDRFFFELNIADNDHYFPRKPKKSTRKEKSKAQIEEDRRRHTQENYDRGIAFPMSDKPIRPSIKKIHGDQDEYPITEMYYDQMTYELVLRRWEQDKQASDIRLFSAVELKLLDPSYIMKIESLKFNTVANERALDDVKMFIYFIELLGTAYEMIAYDRLLLTPNRTLKSIPDITSMHMNEQGYLVVIREKGDDVVFKTNGQVMILDKETIQKMLNMPIHYNHIHMEASMTYFARLIKATANSFEHQAP